MLKTKVLIFVALMLIIPALILAAEKPKTTSAKYDQYGYPIRNVSTAGIRNFLINRDFNNLNKLLDGYQREFENDFRYEYKLYDAYDTFSFPDPAYQTLFDAWVNQYPDFYQPYLARAFYFEMMGWESRGYRWAKDTSGEQFANMKQFFQLAHQDIEAVLKLKPDSICAYQLLINIYRATSAKNRNQEVIANSLRLFPYSFMLRENYLNALKPRWGGSYSRMDAFADEAQPYQKKNPRLRLLKGYSYADKADLVLRDKNYTKAIELYNKALTYGESAYFDYGLAECYYYSNNNATALPFINKALVLQPQYNDAMLLRSKIFYEMDNYNRSLNDLQTVTDNTPGYSLTQKTREWIGKNLVSKGYEQYKVKKYDQAVGLYTYAIRFNPDNAEAYYWRGQAYCYQRELQKAYDDFRRSISLSPQHFHSYLSIDWVLAQSKQWDTIIAYWTKYIKLEPKDGRAYRERGGAYYQKGDLKAALKDAKKAADLGDEEGRKQYERLKNVVK